MDKERAIDMFIMRLEGATYQEIADKYGITRQMVFSILNHKDKDNAKQDFIIYKGLKKWMLENNINVYGLYTIMTGKTTGSGRTKDKLCGITKFSITDIKAIIKESGKTFEELFMQE